MRKRRFELPRLLPRYHLKVVRLPISPPPQGVQSYYNLVNLYFEITLSLHAHFLRSSRPTSHSSSPSSSHPGPADRHLTQALTQVQRTDTLLKLSLRSSGPTSHSSSPSLSRYHPGPVDRHLTQAHPHSLAIT